MSARKTEELVASFIENVLKESGYELYDTEFIKEGPNYYLRIYIDKEDGISIEDCEIASRKVEAILDKKDPIPQAYVLEVSSPGADRKLKKEKDFIKYKGRLVDIKLYKSVDKIKEFQGELQSFENSVIVIKDEKGLLKEFPFKDVAICRLAVVF